MEEGFKLAGAYIDVTIKDSTDDGVAKIREKIKAIEQQPVKVAVEGDTAKASEQIDKWRSETQAKETTLNVKASDPLNAEWKRKIDQALKDTALQGLQVPLNPETQQFHVELEAALAETSRSAKVAVGADLAPEDRAELKAHLEEVTAALAAETQIRLRTMVPDANLEEIRAKILGSVEATMREADELAKYHVKAEADVASARSAGKAVADEAVQAADSNGGRGMSTTGMRWAAIGAAAFIAGGPLLAAAAGTVGAAATVALAYEFEKSQPQIKSAVSNLSLAAKSSFQDGFSAITPVIVSQVNAWSNALHEAEPMFAQLASAAIPFITQINTGLIETARTVIPAFTESMSQSLGLAHALGQGVATLAQGFGQLLTRLDFSQAASGFTLLTQDISALLPVFSNLLNQVVMPLANSLLSSLIPAVIHLVNDFSNDLAPAVHLVAGAISALAPVFNFLAGPIALVGALAVSALTLKSAFTAVANVVGMVKSAFTSYLTVMENVANKFGDMSKTQKEATIAIRESALESATETKVLADKRVVLAQLAMQQEASAANQKELTVAQREATVAAEAQTVAQRELTTAEEASSFAAGPLGMVLAAAGAAAVLFGGNALSASGDTKQLTASMHDLAGVADGTAASMQQFFKDVGSENAPKMINAFKGMGVSAKDFSDALSGSVPAAKKVVDATNGLIKSAENKQRADLETMKTTQGAASYTDAGRAALKRAGDDYQTQSGVIKQYQSILGEANQTLQANTQLQNQQAGATALSKDQTAEAAKIAQQYGISIEDATGFVQAFVTANKNGATGIQDIQRGFTDAAVATTQAASAISQHFQQADQAVADATNSLSNANHSYQQSVQAVADAQYQVLQAQQAVADADHNLLMAERAVSDAVYARGQAQQSVAQAQQGIADANHNLQQSEQGVADALHNRQQAQIGVTTALQGLQDAEQQVVVAENNVQKAQDAETKAQLALTAAREAARQELIALRLQLKDQAASEESARLSLFDQEQSAQKLGITLKNAQDILKQPITVQNESQIKAALALVQAQNALNDSLNTGTNLKEKANAAFKAGVNGNSSVISATDALKSAQDQVVSSEQRLVKAHQSVRAAQQQVANANYAVAKADQAVEQAHYAVTKASQAVQQAHLQLQNALHNLEKANQGVSDAEYNVQKAHQAVEQANHNLVKSHQAVEQALWSEQQASNAVTKAQHALSKARDADSRSLDASTAAGAANIKMLETLSDGIIKQYGPHLDAYNKIVDDTQKYFGLTHDQAIAVDKKLGLIPNDYEQMAKAAADYKKAIDEVNTALQRQATNFSKLYDFQASHPLKQLNGSPSLGHYFGGPTAAGGAIIPGYAPGVDSVHALVSPGEAILVPELVKQIGPQNIMAANARAVSQRHGHFANGGIVGYATGGVVSTPSSPAVTSVATTDIATVAGADAMTNSILRMNVAWNSFVSTLLSQVVPTMSLIEQHVGTLAVEAVQRLDTQMQVGWTNISSKILASSAEITARQGQLDVYLTASWKSIADDVIADLTRMNAFQGQTQNYLTTSWSTIVSNIRTDLSNWSSEQYKTQAFMASSWGYISSVVNTSVNQQNTALHSLESGLAGARDAMTQTANWAHDRFASIVAYAENPIRTVLNSPINAGLIAAWNALDRQFAMNHHVPNVAVPFATGGFVSGPGTGTSDSIDAKLSNGEFVVKASIVEKSLPFLKALNAGQGEALQATGGPHASVQGYASGGLVSSSGSEATSIVNNGMQWLRGQAGKPYVWGGVGPDGYDCSGLVGALTNVLRGEHNPYFRIGLAQTQPWPGFVSGLHSVFGTGFNSHHTAGTLAGVNMEARDFGIPVMVGGNAVGATDHQFTGQASLPFVGGQFMPGGGGGGFDVTAAVNRAFAKVPGMISAVRDRFPGNIAAFDGAEEAGAALAGAKKYAESKLAFLSGAVGSVPPAHGNALAAQKYAQSAMARFGFGPDQWGPLLQLWQKESSWDATQVNSSSGAYGIPQANPSGGQGHPYALGDYANQVIWGLNYIKGRYGNPAGAWAHEQSFNWYDHGGSLMPGSTLVHNGTGAPEMVRTKSEEDALLNELRGLRSDLAAVSARPVVNQTVNAAGTLDEVVTSAARIVTQQLEGVFR